MEINTELALTVAAIFGALASIVEFQRSRGRKKKTEALDGTPDEFEEKAQDIYKEQRRR